MSDEKETFEEHIKHCGCCDDKEFNFLKELKKSIIKEADFQSGEIEFSYTGELVPFEIVEDCFDEFIRLLKDELGGECDEEIDKFVRNKNDN